MSSEPPTRASDQRFAAALSHALAQANMPLTELRSRLRAYGVEVSNATLSSWRSGRTQPHRGRSMQAVNTIEVVLGLPPGALETRIGPDRPRGSSRPPILPDDLFDAPGLREAIDRLGLTSPKDALERTLMATVDVGEMGHEVRVRTRLVAESLVEQLEMLPFLSMVDEPGDRVPHAHANEGCSIGRTIYEPENGMFIGQLILDAPVGWGEPLLIDYTVDLADTLNPDMAYEHGLSRRVPQVVLRVRFCEEWTPKHIEAYTVVDSAEQTHPVELVGRTAIFVRRTFGPGRIGIRWS